MSEQAIRYGSFTADQVISMQISVRNHAIGKGGTAYFIWLTNTGVWRVQAPGWPEDKPYAESPRMGDALAIACDTLGIARPEGAG